MALAMGVGMGCALWFVVLLFFFFFFFSFPFMPVFGASLESVPDLENAMYQLVDGIACVRLLTLDGEIGCANPGRSKVVGPVLRLSNSTETLQQHAAVLLPASELSGFLQRTLKEPALSQQVAGLLVEYYNESMGSAGCSDDEKFPLSKFSLYGDTNYVWNPFGSGIIHHRYDFPVFLLTEDSTKMLQKAAADNQKRHFSHPLKVAEFGSVMQTTKSGTHSSASCLKDWSCLPLGGYSVWSSLPAIDAAASSSGAVEKPIVLAISSIDSSSFFRDRTPGADAPLSGMIALLGAVDALSKCTDAKEWKKQLVFAFFTGEAWGYLGSRRFISELTDGKASVKGLNSSLVHQILEIGPVGQIFGSETRTVFAHSPKNEPFAETEEIWESLQRAAASLGPESINVSWASKTNPGLPPSSLTAFVQKNDSVAGIVLTEYDTAFTNRFFHSRFDNSNNINISAIVSASSLIARTLYTLVAGDSSSSTLSTLTANSSLVEQLVGCLLGCNPGMSCDLVQGLITPMQACANHYVGVFLGDPSDEPLVGNIDDTSRFLWNFLASRTLVGSNNRSECSTQCSGPGEVCIGSTTKHKGFCAVSTTRYVPAFSTRLRYVDSGWVIIPAQPGDRMALVDPVYTESFWKELTLQAYMKESYSHDVILLLMGLLVTAGSFVIIWSTQSIFRKRLKHA